MLKPDFAMQAETAAFAKTPAETRLINRLLLPAFSLRFHRRETRLQFNAKAVMQC